VALCLDRRGIPSEFTRGERNRERSPRRTNLERSASRGNSRSDGFFTILLGILRAAALSKARVDVAKIQAGNRYVNYATGLRTRSRRDSPILALTDSTCIRFRNRRLELSHALAAMKTAGDLSFTRRRASSRKRRRNQRRFPRWSRRSRILPIARSLTQRAGNRHDNRGCCSHARPIVPISKSNIGDRETGILRQRAFAHRAIGTSFGRISQSSESLGIVYAKLIPINTQSCKCQVFVAEAS